MPQHQQFGLVGDVPTQQDRREDSNARVARYSTEMITPAASQPPPKTPQAGCHLQR
ncbi:hypothetical protein [Streptomyces violascens]|uniref:hypothetical protein n=1 Tax=Streptomyces violascens TaxID=67381 RepID=UPI003691BF67